jgi:hypothetical protein
MSATGHRSGSRSLPAALVVAGTLLLSACASSSSPHASIAASASSTTATDSASASSTTATVAKAPPDPVTTGSHVQRPLHGTGGREINDDNPGNADSGNQAITGQLDPCTLVSQAQAQAIVHKPVAAPEEAPLGPTCIYQPLGAPAFITVSVQPTSFATISHSVRNRTSYEVGGRTIYCGDYGQSTTFVPLSSGRVLSIVASCAIGRLFAAKALVHLKT